MVSDTLDRLGQKTQGREAFITKSYQHLLLGIGVFLALETYLFTSGLAPRIANALMSVPWLLVIGALMLIGYLASSLAARAETKGAQYAGLFGLSIAWSIVFVPLIYFAEMRVPGVTKTAGIATAVGFTALTAIAFQTRKDFSFLGGFLRWCGFIALGLIAVALIWGLSLGIWFSAAMLLYAGAAVLYETSNIIHHYPDDRYVSAGLALFAAIALMAWYMVTFFTQLSGD